VSQHALDVLVGSNYIYLIPLVWYKINIEKTTKETKWKLK